MEKFKLLGIAGLARCGKDSFFSSLKKLNNSYVRQALADEVKRECGQVLYEGYKINIFNCSPEEKEFCRPVLVNYANLKRDETNGRHWIDLIEKKVQTLIEKSQIPVITDVRFKNEAEWIHSLGGKVIHLKKYSLKDGQKIYLSPPNKAEEENDPQVEAEADIHLEWIDNLSKENMVKFVQENLNNYEI